MNCRTQIPPTSAGEAPASENVEHFDEYADWTINTAVYPGAGSGDIDELTYLSLGLNGEAGEVAELVKKLIRDGVEIGLSDKIEKELGDVLYYLARLCVAFDFKMSEVATTNRIKLTRRLEEEKIHGSGSDR